MFTKNSRKKEPFNGQKAIVIPREILAQLCAVHDIINALYVTGIGYYPKARYYYREREDGVDQHILVYCQEGKGSCEIGKHKYRIEAGDFFIIPKGTAHMYAADEKKPWTVYWVHFTGMLSDSIYSAIQQKINGYKGYLGYNEKCLELFHQIYRLLEGGYGCEHLLRSNMSLWPFLGTFMNGDDVKEKERQGDAIDKAIDFLSAKTSEVITLEEVASVVNLSIPQFSYLFKKKTGFAPIEYFNHLKVQKACQYLLFTDLRIKEIALEVGISDPLYFSRVFSKVMGMPPNEYRDKRAS